MFTFIKNKLQSIIASTFAALSVNSAKQSRFQLAWRLLRRRFAAPRNDKGLCVALTAFIVARIGLTLWAWLILQINPLVVGNLELFGEKVVVAMNLQNGERAVFSRIWDGRELHFRAAPPNLMDAETQSLWNLRGESSTGARLAPAARVVEEIFPYRGVAIETNPLLSAWQRFDANWYLKIAQRGYAAEDGSTVFFPLFPLLIRLFGGALFVSVLISNLCFLAALYLLYQLACDLVGAPAAARAVALLAIFPTAFFFYAPYTESLFLLLTLASFRAAQKSRWALASIFAALAALTRLQGVLLIAPLAYLWFKNVRKRQDYKLRIMNYELRITHHASLIMLLLIPLVSAAFIAYTNGALLTAYEAQLSARFVLPWENFAASLALIARGGAGGADILNLLATILFGLMLMPVWRKLPREYFLYAALMFAAPLLRMTTTQPLVSMSRYVLVMFPVFIVWGAWTQNAWIQRALVYPSLALLLFLSAQFFLWGWVA